MGFIPRRRIIENLNTTQVFIEDTQNEYFIVQDIPDTFVQGRSAFKIFGSQFLKKNVPLKIEILDKDGNTVYVQPVKYGQGISPKLPHRYISVEVYPPPFNVPGEAELVILGELDETKVPFNIPNEFIGTYNVRYLKKVNIDTATVINTQPILFYKKPTVSATSTTVAQKKSDPPANAFVAGTNLYGIVNKELKSKRFETGSAVNVQENFDEGGKSDTPSGDVKTETNLWKYKSGLYSKRAVLTRRGISEERESPEPPQMRLYSTTPAFNSKMVGGEITVTNINLTDSEKSTLSGFGNDGVGAVSQEDINEMFTFPTYKARVESVISDKQLTTSKPYSLQFESPSVGELRMYSDIGSSSPSDNLYASYSASYLDWAVPTTSSYRFDTIVDLDISNLRTFSGDVYRMKVYGASDSAQGEFPVLLDTIVESPETLVDTDILKFPLRTGYFLDQDHIDKYWNSFGGDNNTGTINTVSTSSVYVDGLYISGSYRGYKEVGRFELDQDYAFTVKKDIPYTLSFQATAKKTEKVVNSGGKVESYAKLMIHLSGSNLSADSRLDITHASSFGQSLTNATNQKVGLELKTDEPYNNYDFPRVSHTFFPKFKLDTVKNDDTIIQFRIESGEWYISDVSLKPARDTGFSPDEMKIRIPLPPNTQRPDNYDLFLEYYDINGNTADATTFVDNVGISGSALVVEGGDNLLTGSLFIGNLQGQGIEMAGANSAYMRSIGYEGFVSASAGQGGFMIFSGSVLPDAPDNYAGAGLEIHDGTVGDDESFFKFRTNPSEFKVKTDSFFFGNKTSGQFISGSNGNLQMSSSRFFLGGSSQFVSGALGNVEISSSNFHLQPDGDVVMQGTITAEAGGTIGGWDITSDAISDLNASGKGIEIKSHPSTPIITIKEDDNNKIELYHTTTNNFGVKGVSGSLNVFQLGSTNQIAGWSFDNSTISSNNLIIDSSGELRTNDYDPQFAGWIITPKAGGFAEFENIRIRGTLRTTTFEKETVNAVGGQVWVANSTAVTKSVAASDNEIICENVSGFQPGEVIFAKKVANQGFTKEFMTITSSSREDASSDTNFVGTLFVDRETNELSSSFTSSITNLDGAVNAFQTELTVDDNANELDKSIIKVDFEYMKVTGSRGTTKIQVLRGADGSQKATHSDNAVVGQLSRDAAMVASFLSPRETYTPGQVLVSTGRFLGGEGTNTTGSGYMLLNANPTTGDTPFMDFAERTGSGVYDVRLKTRLGDLSGLIKSRFGREVGISDNPGFGLASENVFLSGMIRANSGSIGGITMGSEKIFTGGGGHGDADTGFFASQSGDFSLSDTFVWTANPGTLDVSGSAVRFNTPEFVLGGLNNFISGSAGGLNINFPSFSVSTAGIMTATDGNFKGNISATSGFIGSGTGSGWNIDGSTIGDVNNIIELDANQDSPNITITSASFVAEFVPDFTPANVILSAGGNSYSASIALGNLTDASWNGSAFSFTNNNGDTDTTNVSTGQTSNVLELFGGFTGTQGGGASTHTTLGSITDVTLSGGNKVYKSTATVRISIAVDTPQFSNNSTITGTATIGGNITLRASSDNSIVATQALSSNLNIDRDTFASTTRINKNVSVSFNHTVVTDTTDYYFEIDDVTVTNNGITESHIAGGKTVTSTPNITAIAAYFTAMSHQPSNKKTEIAPAGIQTVLLGNSTLENSANTFVRISPEEPKTLETQGSVHVTGSIQIRELGASDTTTVGSDITTTGHIETSEYLKTGNGDENTPAIQLGSTNDGLYHSGGISFVINNDTTVLFADGGHIHADNDVTAFSTSVTSDIRLKENIKPLKNNLNKILQLKPSSFTWLVKDKQDDIGLIAQEVEKIIPEVIKTNVSIGKTKEFLKGDNHKTVDYSKITTHLIGAIQEQQKQIDELKKKLEEL